ncbi:isoprenoid biosynthesis protein ElbB [Geovibrio thiophilus]|uniref:Isoprenoid biosynthesis protein ElbB n=1 Tax=Geovibrio thiophilus TaxID=139438 RepID=A0A410JXS9_9BACT|nr:isoprenoid biosynthesis glyoxalase ElbB [Geovibrio thiophilus]QAR32919.1 isoprenoid biosynthesis protein ElbB [Geovibrio thiophilus]
MPKIGVVLSGCGVFDGAEIHEAVLTLYFLQKSGAETICMAPDIEQLHVVDHLRGEVAAGEKRNVLTEAARIARGNIKNLADVKVSDFDALIFPGGFGNAKNLTDFAVKGADCGINPDVLRIVRETVMAKKPLGAVCIAPVVIAKALEGTGIKTSVTIGSDSDTAHAVEALGTTHVNCPVKDFVADEKNKIVTSPAYMLGRSIPEVAEGIEKTVHKLLAMI